ncbi:MULTISPECIES: ATP-dependent helicase [unclassified Microbacterium]|uniref:ATP-dependent helicase n=1 Tax=unclassified Microbacterium TaxID=2609290 RepID=UPI0016576093|nr:MULTISPECIES: ATP-dependent DNA helicase [unclassified Microbacterium]MCT1364448.1 ATP-dependent helicase [Microbacterium sp. p3-SID131]MCT1376459.1 ATP-dependent helicase [Microbacterium sp. p3-SID337]MDH5134741.1 ATP-dependent DNA helicase [Microbacterium sp. RD10]MDH5138333.1 ATP-dependent DNA helicase [Microbacterium sp. RD11]MDH5146415.1 ATP-dependent DNA helicase [Microbacterium sp. RD12]
MMSDAAQRAVITAPPTASGVVIGAPGTGKTRTLVDRVVQLLEVEGLRPEEVLALTPSRQAATALRDRIGVRIGQATPGPLARSLGSFAFQLVRGAMVREGAEPPALLTGADQDRIIAELLAGDAEDARIAWPPALSEPVRASKGFRSELRAFLAECTELGASPAELRATGDAVWTAAADFVEEYRAVLDALRAAHRDAADLLSEAAGILRTADSATLGPLSPLRVVLIDDAQELTRGGIGVVQALLDRGIAVHAFGDPDISSGAFRGASPELFAQLAGALTTVHVLDGAHRQRPLLTALTRTVTQAIGVSGRVEHRRAPAPTAGDDSAEVSTFLAPSPYEEFDRIAGVMRDWHLSAGIPWERMAVIAHDTRQVTALETELAAREIPTRAAGVQRPLGSEGIVRDIVGIVRLALTPDEDRTVQAWEEALRTPFGGMDAIALRRLRARLRHLELGQGGSTPARELLRAAMSAPATLTLIDAPESRTAERFAETVAGVARAAAEGETIHDLLWRIWEQARAVDGRRLQVAWREISLLPTGAETARSLDALVALFDAAKRFVERTPDERPEVFVRDILDSEVPEDTLSSPDRPGTVTLLTPATALGTEFDAVVVAGVQDGVWPNVRLRGGLLQTWRLADALTAARSGLPAEVPGVLDRRRAALHDELRLFVRALSRARHRLLITAVDDDDLSPSAFFGFLPPPEPPERHASAEHPLTLRGLVARHRRVLTTTHAEPARREAAAQLAILAREGVPGAHPHDWYGVTAPSTAAPLRDLAASGARVSPSAVESYEECGLNWVVSALGGDTVMPPTAGIGTIVHEAMERVPDGDLARMREIVEEHWPELDFETAWIGRKERRRADLFVDRLHSYLGEVTRDGGRVLGSEVEFRFAVDVSGETAEPSVYPVGEDRGHRAIVHGYIDRVEAYPPGAGEHGPARGRGWQSMAGGPEGTTVVVDLKTGKTDPEADGGVVDHAQLAAYQIAVQEGLVPGAAPGSLGGARLVIVSKTLAKSDYRVAHQHALDAEARSQFLHRVAEVARGMSAASFTAQVEAHCADTQRRVHPCRIHTVPAVSA